MTFFPPREREGGRWRGGRGGKAKQAEVSEKKQTGRMGIFRQCEIFFWRGGNEGDAGGGKGRGKWVLNACPPTPHPGSVREKGWMGAKAAASRQSASLGPFPWVRGWGGLQMELTPQPSSSSSSPPHTDPGHCRRARSQEIGSASPPSACTGLPSSSTPRTKPHRWVVFVGATPGLSTAKKSCVSVTPKGSTAGPH